MSENNKIRIVNTHDQGHGAIEFCIPKEFRQRYDLERPAQLMLIAEKDYFKVMKLRLAIPEGVE